jgi:hypothetical protein
MSSAGSRGGDRSGGPNLSTFGRVFYETLAKRGVNTNQSQRHIVSDMVAKARSNPPGGIPRQQTFGDWMRGRTKVSNDFFQWLVKDLGFTDYDLTRLFFAMHMNRYLR